MEWLKEHFKALGAGLLIVALMVTSFVPSLAPYQVQILALSSALGFGGTAMLSPFLVKKQGE